jgi:hypothetical protein
MWLVLGAAVGIAALVSHRSGDASPLGRPVRVGEIRVALPLGWETKSGGGLLEALLGTSQVSATSPDAQRVISVVVADGSESSLEAHLLHSLLSVDAVEPYSQGVLDFGAGSGQWMAGDCPRTLHRTRKFTGVIVGAARLPSGNIVRIELRAARRNTADMQLLKRVAASVRPVETIAPGRPASNEES